MPKIFISYRRDDSQIIAHRIYDALADAFGAENVFIDVDDIPPGDDFRDFLNNEIARNDVVLVLIADKWAEIMRQRLRNPDDFVRIELLSALEQRKRVIPILLGDAKMPRPQDLPERVRTIFPYLNAKSVGLTKHFHRDMQELIPFLQDWETILPPRPLPAIERPQRRFPRTPLLSFSLIMLLLVIAVLAYPYLSAILVPIQETPSPSTTEAPTENTESTEVGEASTDNPTDSPTEAPSDSPELSPTPSSNQLVFVRSALFGNIGKELFLIDIDSDDVTGTALTNDGYNDENPRWSPDGSRIAYESFRNNSWVIMIMNADGSEPFQLTSSGINSTQPHWSPDGETIAFARGNSGSREIFIQRLDETSPVEITTNDLDAFWPVWYSDNKIYFITDNQGANSLNQVDINSKQVEAIASLGGNVTAFDISPDRSSFVYSMDTIAGNPFVPDIYVMDSATNETRNLTAALRGDDSCTAHYNYPSWSPDSSRIVFMSSCDSNSNNELFIMNADGSQLERVTNTDVWEWTSSWKS